MTSEMNYLGKTVLDFFAGIGLVRYALERRGWTEIYALDHSPLKSAMYKHHFGDCVYSTEDIHTVQATTIPTAVLAHASFPCTDTSVAGGRQGLAGPGSSAFWGFTRVLGELAENRPPLVLLENVEGFLISNKGQDLTHALKALNNLGYCVDLILVDAAYFVPQSRVRLFIIGVKDFAPHNVLEQDIVLRQKTEARPKKIITYIKTHSAIDWYLSDLPMLPKRAFALETIIDPAAPWWDRKRSDYLFDQMHDHHRARVTSFTAQNRWTYGTAFRRMRMRNGTKQSTAEVRFDGIAGCLRTPKGGSARQIVIRAGFGTFDARLLNACENARLMGADEYKLSTELSLNDALFGFGDAVCVPVIEWVSQYSLEPLYVQLSGQQLQPAFLETVSNGALLEKQADYLLFS